MQNNAISRYYAIEKGKTYLVRVADDCSYDPGTSGAFEAENLSMKDGWNLIGVNVRVPVEDLEAECGSVLAMNLSSGMLTVERNLLEPGTGYLVRVENDCNIDLTQYEEEPPEFVDCGEDIECFIDLIETCNPGNFTYNDTLNLSYIWTLLDVVEYFEIYATEDEDICNITQKLVSYKMNFTAEYFDTLLTIYEMEDINYMIDTMNEFGNFHAGLTGNCEFGKDIFAEFFENISQEIFDYTITISTMEGANAYKGMLWNSPLDTSACSGELYTDKFRGFAVLGGMVPEWIYYSDGYFELNVSNGLNNETNITEIIITEDGEECTDVQINGNPPGEEEFLTKSFMTITASCPEREEGYDYNVTIDYNITLGGLFEFAQKSFVTGNVLEAPEEPPEFVFFPDVINSWNYSVEGFFVLNMTNNQNFGINITDIIIRSNGTVCSPIATRVNSHLPGEKIIPSGEEIIVEAFCERIEMGNNYNVSVNITFENETETTVYNDETYLEGEITISEYEKATGFHIGDPEIGSWSLATYSGKFTLNITSTESADINITGVNISRFYDEPPICTDVSINGFDPDTSAIKISQGEKIEIIANCSVLGYYGGNYYLSVVILYDHSDGTWIDLIDTGTVMGDLTGCLIDSFYGKEDYEICFKDKQTLDQLLALNQDLDSSKIDIRSIEDGNVSVLYIEDADLVDITPLSSLSGLTEISLQNNDIVDISPLAALGNIADLDLGVNQIVDLAPLSSLTKITNLNLMSNRIIDVSPLSTLTELDTLGIGYNKISDISSLSTLTKLNILDIRYTCLDPENLPDFVQDITHVTTTGSPTSGC
ncbi:MAG: hypothetical protein JW716_01395 [Candidatus Aenigmarchaeota archaeon]|nr:hypothetical protein [Candidatus Aenigmarchaeota archaeon]